MASCSVLEPLMSLFQCGGQHDQAVIDDVYFHDDGTPRMSNLVGSTTSIYSIPSKESLKELRQDSMKRTIQSGVRTSPLFSRYTASEPMEFTFDDEDDTTNTLSQRRGGVEEAKGEEDDEMERTSDEKRGESSHRYTIYMEPRRESSSYKSYAYGTESFDTASTAENSSIFSMRRTRSESLSELPIDSIAPLE